MRDMASLLSFGRKLEQRQLQYIVGVAPQVGVLA